MAETLSKDENILKIILIVMLVSSLVSMNVIGILLWGFIYYALEKKSPSLLATSLIPLYIDILFFFVGIIATFFMLIPILILTDDNYDNHSNNYNNNYNNYYNNNYNNYYNNNYNNNDKNSGRAFGIVTILLIIIGLFLCAVLRFYITIKIKIVKSMYENNALNPPQMQAKLDNINNMNGGNPAILASTSIQQVPYPPSNPPVNYPNGPNENYPAAPIQPLVPSAPPSNMPSVPPLPTMPYPPEAMYNNPGYPPPYSFNPDTMPPTQYIYPAHPNQDVYQEPPYQNPNMPPYKPN